MRLVSQTFTARPVEAEDLEAASGLLEQLGYAVSAAQLGERLGARPLGVDHQVLVAERHVRGQSSLVVGLLTLEVQRPIHRPRPEAEVFALVVDRSFRHLGVGRLLMATAAAWARRAGCDRLHLRSNHQRDQAHAFYRGLGLEETHLAFTQRL